MQSQIHEDLWERQRPRWHRCSNSRREGPQRSRLEKGDFLNKGLQRDSDVISLSIMNTVNIADLRNHFRRVSAWIENGESVKILRRGTPYAILSPLPQDTQSQPVQVDFAAQRRAIWRGRRFSVDEVEEMRDAELGSE